MLTKYLLLVILLLSNTINNFAESNKHFTASAKPSKLVVKEGETFQIQFTISFNKGWHAYSLKEQIGPDGIGPAQTIIDVEPKDLIKLNGKIKSPKPIIKYDSAFSMKLEKYYGKNIFILPVLAKKNIDFGKNKLFVSIDLQQCTEVSCLPPELFKIPVSKETFVSESFSDSTQEDVAEIQATDEIDKKVNNIDKSVTTESSTEIQSKINEGLIPYLLFSMLMGLLALFTPCVFPMVPITVSFFTKRAEKNKGKGLRDSLIYTLGIITTFTGIGLVLSLLFGASAIQDFATNPWLNIGIAVLFVVFALNLFGAFEIQLPTGLLNRLNQKSQQGGIFSVLLMGLTFSLTSFTCTVPFVGNAIFSVSQGEWFYPVIGMMGFSFVFAIPFFFLALFPSLINKLPKAGGWMNNIKVVMGFLEIAFAIKFISNADLVWTLGIMPRDMFLAIWIGCSILITIYILGIFRLTHDSPVSSVGSLRIIWAIIFASITFYLIGGLFGRPLGELDAFLPPPDYNELISSTAVVTSTNKSKNETKTKTSELFWYSNYQEALEAAKKENKPLFVDFTGVTCTNCRWMEINMFTKGSVIERFDKMIKVKLFTDRRTVESDRINKQMQQERFNSIELPLYVILTPDEKLIGSLAFTRDENEFINFLDRAFKE
jgi:thiol:disulfide interchange protein DsbD